MPDRPAEPRRSKLWWIVRLCATLALLGEFTLRFFGFGHPLLYVADGPCGYLPAPSQNVRRFKASTQINAQSMRSPPIVLPKPAGEFRVLFIGDSVVFGGTTIDQSKIVTSRLNVDLPAQFHRPVEVLNASAGGWAIGNEVGYLRSRGAFGADAIVFLLNSADLAQPFADVVPGKDPSFPDRMPQTAIGEVVSRYVKPRLMGVKLADRGSEAPASIDLQPAIAARLKELDEAKSLAATAGAKFAIVYSPLSDGRGNIAPECRIALTALRKWGSEQGVDVLDLEPAFVAAGTATCYRDAAHHTERGMEVTAHAIETWPTLHEFDARSAKTP